MKIALLVVSTLTIIAIVVAALQENYFADWYHYRHQYEDLLERKATDDAGRAAAALFDVGVVQNFVPELGAVDRCMTCHAGVEDPRMVDADAPFTTHPGRYLELHDPSKFGCTVCHEGQGRATTVADAHGHVPHWDWPMLEERYIKSSCSKCHEDSALYGVNGLIEEADGDDHGQWGDWLLADGRWLATERGCMGCHVVDGKGGTLGPDLTFEGDKTRHDLDFSHLPREVPRTVTAWLEHHFLEPTKVSPGSLMPPVRSEKEAAALTGYTLSRHRKLGGSAVYRDDPASEESVDGEHLYLRYCAACHGSDGRQTEVPGITTPALNNYDFLAVADDDFLRMIISSGRTGTNMPAWREGVGNLTRSEIDRIVEHIRGWEPDGASELDVSSARGEAKQGRAYYRALCAGCHGIDGEGGVGNSLSSESFLAIADDRMLARSIIQGRPGTAMPSWRHLSAQAVSDIMAYIRSWQPTPPTFDEVREAMSRVPAGVNANFGKAIYSRQCAGCHGAEGNGAIGPSLVSDEFLRLVDDRYLYKALVEGRPSTAMPAWKQLAAADIGALIAHLRSYQNGPALAQGQRVASGDYNVGQVLYDQACSGCHGVAGSGGVGPQLANPVFLESVTDGALKRWIERGRTGTAMKGFAPEAQGPLSLDDGQVADVIAYLRFVGSQNDSRFQRIGIGRAEVGSRVYAESCAACHGPEGEGASGPQLANPYFLDAVSDGFLEATIVLGRSGTAMQAMVVGAEGLGQLSTENVQDLVAYMRTWEQPRTWRLTRRVSDVTDTAVSAGAEAYASYCGGCHGADGLGSNQGDGSFAPALNNRDFLAAASDGYLLATIARGRSGTAMRPFGIGGGGIVELDSETISNIVSFIRAWQSVPTEAATRGESNEEG
jgi:mono/diheme cytochrome c family protein